MNRTMVGSLVYPVILGFSIDVDELGFASGVPTQLNILYSHMCPNYKTRFPKWWMFRRKQ
jgi:hypothetical protein